MIDDYDNSEENFETVRLFEEYCDKTNISFGFSCFEDFVPMAHYAHCLFHQKKRTSMTIHAGDNGGPENCSMVIDFGASRIGHGHKCYNDKAVLRSN